eukprot:scaffold1859_cov103-Isochrysis_galbana.AAC.6
MSACTSTPSERIMDEHSSKWRYLVGLANCPRGQGGGSLLSLKFIFRMSFVEEKLTRNEMMIIIILGGNVARERNNGGAGLWLVGRLLCLATAAPLGLRMWTFHAAPWKG